MPDEKSSEGLKRVVGVTGLAASVVNLTIGVGIYALPAIIAIQLGPAAIIGYVSCALMLAAIILCYVEIGSRVKTAGGSYAYVESAFGPFAGFIINWLFFFGWGILGDAAVMNIIADSLGVLFPIFSTPVMRVVLFLILIMLMIFVNVRDARQSVRIVKFITVIKLIPLIALIIFGLGHIQLSNLKWEHLPSIKAFGDTALILFFAFAGFESSLSVSGEIKDPKRTVPRGILLGGIMVVVIYILIQTILQGVLGTHVNEFRDAPLAALAEKIVGPVGLTLILIAAAISGAGLVNGDILASSRLLFAGANDGIFPKFLGKVHKRFETPYWAIITYALLIFILSVSGGFKQLAVLASGALLIIYLAVILAMIKLRMKKIPGAEKSFKVPGGLIIPGIAIAGIIYVLSNLTKEEILSLTIFIAVLCVMYFVMKRFQNRSAVIGLAKIKEE